ncbi:predicted flavoprotein [Longilinea arvoryzae]|uniref:Predicted flavoprotein n=1 Tax=Longilinea arvoryzae TaxID=360412 RepID=A0A0S7BGG6_9CHLR|nr:NAD(P)-binding domain-containing protein [Longilinea arvoryzae]GAP12538.1 predicted flavoprotein [Longilinea arvoryzae]
MTRKTETIETVIVGGGQAGLSMSYYLTQQQREHVVLEKTHRAGSAWTQQRWDSFTLVTPNWGFRLPGAEYAGSEPNGFMPRAEVDQRFQDYIRQYTLPLLYGVEVQGILPREKGYLVRTNDRNYRAKQVVVASGLFQRARVPAWARLLPPDVHRLAACDYRNPDRLPPGAVLVVGSGQSGCQIAEELNESGRKVYLCVGGAGRFPRRYRGRDVFEWVLETGLFRRTADQLPSPAARFGPNPHVTGKNGGHSLNLHQFQRDGIVLLGHVRDFQDGKLILAADLKESLAKADKAESDFVRLVDETIIRNGYSDPPEQIPQLSDGYSAPEYSTLDLREAGIHTVIWAGGFAFDFSMVKLPVFDSFGYPITRRGATEFAGLYFLGLPWLYRQTSGLLYGVGEDAAYLAEEMAKR